MAANKYWWDISKNVLYILVGLCPPSKAFVAKKSSNIVYVQKIPKVWVKKSGHCQKLAFSKKSTIFIQSPWNLAKIIISLVNHFAKVSWWLDKNCGFFTNGQFLPVSTFFYPDFISSSAKMWWNIIRKLHIFSIRWRWSRSM